MHTEATPAQADVSELDLVRRCQAGDTEAFDELVTRYRTRVFGMIYNMVHSEQDAWDLGPGQFPEGVEIDRTIPRPIVFLYLDLPDRDERHDRLAAEKADQSRRRRVRRCDPIKGNRSSLPDGAKSGCIAA